MRLSSFLLFVLLSPVPALAQHVTPWGDPDLQGVWTNQTPVPLERPQALGDKAFFTEEESAAFEKTSLDRLLGQVAVELPTRMHEVRIIPLDGRQHVGAGIRSWLGDSRGRWEGKTLVVETTNFNDKKLFRGATKDMRVVERFTRLDDETIAYRLTVTDPATFASPWTIEHALRKSDGMLYEVACHEGNYGLAGILSAARAEQAR